MFRGPNEMVNMKEVIDFIQGHGTTQESQDYAFIDETPLDGTNYYRLKQVDFDCDCDLFFLMLFLFRVETLHRNVSTNSNVKLILNILN